MNEWLLECVRPIEEDAKLVMAWRNDPATRAMSFHHEEKVWPDFYGEFIDAYFSHPTLPPLFIRKDGRRVSFIRFREVNDPKVKGRACADISIIVDPDRRGGGIGKKSLELVKEWIGERDVGSILAEVKEENIASSHLFAHGGFQKIGKRNGVERFLWELITKKSVFIIAEAGSNWKVGNASNCWYTIEKMIETAAEAGANAIKFQTFRADKVYVPNAGRSDYLSEGGMHEEITEILKEHELPFDWIPKIAEKCQASNIEFMSSIFSEDDYQAVNPHVKRHKVASYELSHPLLLQMVAGSGKPILLSTGASNEEEIAWAVSLLRKQKAGPLTLLQCTAQYPANPGAMHLRTIPWLRRRFHVSSGLSDHSSDPFTAPIAAVALGAVVIEKHFTLDRTLPGPDHYFAVTPSELREMIEKIRLVEEMLGERVKKVDPCEEELYSYAKRALQAIVPIREGDPLQLGVNVGIFRPGKQKKGLHPMHMEDMMGKKAARNISPGEGIQYDDYR